ncbi:hypothetical protein SDJN02_06824, partial [Cucurbita argyrosperma subsp. argyrosperma]
MAPSISLLHLAFCLCLFRPLSSWSYIFHLQLRRFPSDTGNLYYTCSSPNPAHVLLPSLRGDLSPSPTGRFSDGRVILTSLSLLNFLTQLCYNVLFPDNTRIHLNSMSCSYIVGLSSGSPISECGDGRRGD